MGKKIGSMRFWIKQKQRKIYLTCMSVKVLKVLDCIGLLSWKEMGFLSGYVWQRRGKGDNEEESVSVT